jgi:hypothetical protein
MKGETSAMVSARESCCGSRVGLEVEGFWVEGDPAARSSAMVKRGRVGGGGGFGGGAMAEGGNLGV